MVAESLLTGSIPKRARLRQQVSDSLRAALIAGELIPGEVYSAPALGERLGVSATPVREAMLDFVRDGMVEVVPNTGFRVTTVTSRELDELTEIRLMIEVPTMSQIASMRDADLPAKLERLRPLVDVMMRAAETGDLLAYLEADTEFHLKFLTLHGNGRLVDVIRQLRANTRLYGLRALADSGRLLESTREHGEMIDVALRHDTVEMIHLIRTHIGHVRNEWAAD